MYVYIKSRWWWWWGNRRGSDARGRSCYRAVHLITIRAKFVNRFSKPLVVLMSCDVLV